MEQFSKRVAVLLIPLAALLLFAAPATAKKKRPDLAMTSVTAPSPVEAGKAFEAGDVVKNSGRKRSKGSTVTYSLSGTAGGEGGSVLGTRSVPALRPKKKSPGSANLTVPAETTRGGYFLRACAAGKFREKSTRNNCRAVPLQIKSDAPVNPTDASLSIDPAGGDLAATLVGQVSPVKTFTVTNAGGSPSGPISGEFGSAPFSPTADGCTGSTLAPGATCSFGIVFSPTARGPAQSQVSIQAVPGGTVSAPVSATGLAPASLSISDSTGPQPERWDFGTVLVGGDATSHTYTVANGGDVATGALTAAYTGGSTDDFVISGGTCIGGVTLGPGSTCTVIANFHPLTSGIKLSTLEVSGTPGGAASAEVRGQGQTAANLVLSPILHNYGNVAFNSFRDATFTIINTGQATSSAISLSISGNDANRFSIPSTADACTGQTLASGASCSFTVRFTPLNGGAKSAFVSFSAAQGGTGSAALSGTGT